RVQSRSLPGVNSSRPSEPKTMILESELSNSERSDCKVRRFSTALSRAARRFSHFVLILVDSLSIGESVTGGNPISSCFTVPQMNAAFEAASLEVHIHLYRCQDLISK